MLLRAAVGSAISNGHFIRGSSWISSSVWVPALSRFSTAVRPFAPEILVKKAPAEGAVPKNGQICGVPPLPGRSGLCASGPRAVVFTPRLGFSLFGRHSCRFRHLKNVCSLRWSSFVLLQKCVYCCCGTKSVVLYEGCARRLFFWFDSDISSLKSNNKKS